jgi:hypothetical protein
MALLMTDGRFSQNQALEGGNLRNEQGQRNAATELCTANRVEMFHFLLTLADEVLSTPLHFRFQPRRALSAQADPLADRASPSKHLII